MQEFRQYDRPQVVGYGIWILSILLILTLFGVVVLMTLVQ